MQLFIFALSTATYFVMHSVLASHRVKNLLIDRWISKKYYRLAYNTVAIITLLLLVYLFQQIQSTYLFSSSLVSYIGLVFAIIGILLLFYALSQYNLGEFSGMEQLREETHPSPQKLKTNGFNSIVRHPLYFAGLIIIWGLFIFSPSSKGLIAALITSAYLYFGTKLEEQKLVLEFGEEYKDYQKRVGMLVPFLK